MSRAGYVYEAGAKTHDDVLRQDYSDDVRSAKQRGYGLLAEHRAVKALLVDEPANTLSPQQLASRERALSGTQSQQITITVAGWTVKTPGAGCSAQAQKTLYGSVRAAVAHDEMISNVVNFALDKAEEDPAVQDKFSNWQSCMQGRGYPKFEGRNGARGLADANYESSDSSQAHAEELRIAADDATCDQKSGYAPVRKHADLVQLSAFLAKNEALVIDLQDKQKAALRSARRSQF